MIPKINVYITITNVYYAHKLYAHHKLYEYARLLYAFKIKSKPKQQKTRSQREKLNACNIYTVNFMTRQNIIKLLISLRRAETIRIGFKIYMNEMYK